MKRRRAALAGLSALAVLAGLWAPACAAAGWPGPRTPLRFAPEQDYGPFVFRRADGTIDGLSVEMLGLVAKEAGLEIRTLPAAPLQVQLDALRERRADLITSLRPTPERAAYLLFTRPYVSVPTVVAMRADRPARTLAELDGRPVGVGQGYAVEAVVRRRHPAVDWRAVPDDAQALRAVVDGRFDAAVVDAASLAFLVREAGLTGLQAAAPADFEYALSFAVRADWPEARDALDEALRNIPAGTRQAVLRRWLSADAPPSDRTPWATRIGAGLVGLALLAALVFGRRRSGVTG